MNIRYINCLSNTNHKTVDFIIITSSSSNIRIDTTFIDTKFNCIVILDNSLCLLVKTKLIPLALPILS